MNQNAKDVLAKRLREAREEAGWSQQHVANALGLHRPSVSMIELGRRDVTAIELVALAKVYGQRPEVFLEDLLPCS